MAKKRYYSEMSEKMEGGMISKDMTKIANMPQEVIMKEYPRIGFSSRYIAGDDIYEIDRQMKKDDSGMRKNMQPEKY